MYRGSTTNLSLAGMLFILLTTLSALYAPKRHAGGVYYYDENGIVLWYTYGDTARSYVVRTTKSPQEIYGRLDSARLKDGSPHQPAQIYAISKELYNTVVGLIRDGYVDSSLVQQNIIEVEHVSVFRDIFDKIPDDGKGGTLLNNNREYGGMIKWDNSITKIDTGDRSFPCAGGAGVRIYGKGKAEFHTHPSGTFNNNNSAGCGFIQAPSKDDLDAVEKRRGYVFGMSSKLIYIYDNKGLLATLPFSWMRGSTLIVKSTSPSWLQSYR
jgi:hypothetical protein